MAASRRHFGAVAEVPRVPGGLHRDWNRSRNLGVDRGVPEDLTLDPVRDIVGISRGSANPPNCRYIPAVSHSSLKQELLRQEHNAELGIMLLPD